MPQKKPQFKHTILWPCWFWFCHKQMIATFLHNLIKASTGAFVEKQTTSKLKKKQRWCLLFPFSLPLIVYGPFSCILIPFIGHQLAAGEKTEKNTFIVTTFGLRKLCVISPLYPCLLFIVIWLGQLMVPQRAWTDLRCRPIGLVWLKYIQRGLKISWGCTLEKRPFQWY